jgi:hypothetical protein
MRGGTGPVWDQRRRARAVCSLRRLCILAVCWRRVRIGASAPRTPPMRRKGEGADQVGREDEVKNAPRDFTRCAPLCALLHRTHRRSFDPAARRLPPRTAPPRTSHCTSTQALRVWRSQTTPDRSFRMRFTQSCISRIAHPSRSTACTAMTRMRGIGGPCRGRSSSPRTSARTFRLVVGPSESAHPTGNQRLRGPKTRAINTPLTSTTLLLLLLLLLLTITYYYYYYYLHCLWIAVGEGVYGKVPLVWGVGRVYGNPTDDPRNTPTYRNAAVMRNRPLLHC